MIQGLQKRVFEAVCFLLAAQVACCGAGDRGIDDMEVSSSQCQDGEDNDRDGLTDCDDEGCSEFVFCSDSGPDGDIDSDGDTDSDTDSDGDADSDSDTDWDTDTGDDLEWVEIQGGLFVMGDERFVNTTPVHEVTVPSFEMTRTEITVAQYKACVDIQECDEPNTCLDVGSEDTWLMGLMSYPVNCITWEQASAFCSWTDPQGRLPSESEWEYAARSRGQDNVYPWGNEDPSCDRAVISGCSQWVEAPCSRPDGSSEQGLCDLAGNLWEWTSDYYHRDYKNAPVNGSAQNVPEDEFNLTRVLRGGGYRDLKDSDALLTTYRQPFNPLQEQPDQGFRCAR